MWLSLLLAALLLACSHSYLPNKPTVRQPLPLLASKRGRIIPQEKDGRISVSTFGALAAGGILTAVLSGLLSPPMYNTAADIKLQGLSSQLTLDGVVLKVVDGDTYRVRHTPSFFSSSKVTGPLGDKTIVVRAYAIDTPESAKFGNQAQPFAEASKEFAKKRLLNRKVKVKCLSRDQYGRIIGQVTYDSGRDISEELLSEGLAVVYRRGNAQYGKDGTSSKWDQIENRAQEARKNLWKDGPINTNFKKAQKKVSGNSPSSQRVKFARSGKKAEAYIK